MSVTPQTTPQRTVFGPGRKAPPTAVARQGQAQHRSNPREALRARARSQQGRPTAHLQRMLADCFTALTLIIHAGRWLVWDGR
jgi:hypothetical protein